MKSFLKKEYDKESIFEVIELMKKNIIENHKGSLEELKKKIIEIENQRIQVVNGDKEIIKKIVEDYKKMKS